MQRQRDYYATRCTEQEMTDSDLREMLYAEQQLVLVFQHINRDCVYVGAHSGTLGVVFSQPRVDPTTGEILDEVVLQAGIHTPKQDLWPVGTEQVGESGSTERFEATVRKESGETEDGEHLKIIGDIKREFCSMMQARHWIQENISKFESYPVKKIDGLKFGERFTPHPSG